MEDDFDAEIIRIKKLVEDRFLQTEKESMAILKNSNNHQDTFHSVLMNKKSCPHVKSPFPQDQTESFVHERDVHSRIHFLNDMQNALLPTFKERSIVSKSRNKYMPCAIPLSPPTRLKRDADENIPFLEKNQNMHAPPIHTCGKSSLTLALATCPSAFNKSLKKDRTLIEKHFPSAAVYDMKDKVTTVVNKKEPDTQVKNAYQNTSVIFTNQNSHNQNDSVISNQKISVPKEKKLSKAKQDADFHKEPHISNSKFTKEDDAKDCRKEKNGLYLEISLDSPSTNDAINKILNEIINKPQAVSNQTKEVSCSTETKEEEEKKFTSTVLKPTKISKEENGIVTSSTQTDKSEEELPIKKHELRSMVKEIVLDTLKSIHIGDNYFVTKTAPTKQRVDSGIQTEEESDTPEHVIDDACCAGNALKQSNILEASSYLPVSKDVQVHVNTSQDSQLKNLLDKSSVEIPNYSCELLQRESPSFKRTDSVSSTPERSSTPKEKFSIELMLEKIYEHVCKEKEAANNFSDNQHGNSIYTRDVAVQFNPLHTETKSTSTVEVKKIDSSCQYDILNEIYSKISTTDASVQVENLNKKILEVVDSGTQYNKEWLSNAITQTEADSEHSVTNTSACTTPASESMFMDDLLSEGEIRCLPWNLRLLSLAGGTAVISNPEYSDTSIKEKDYSLSEGEVHPSIVPYLNMYPYNNNDTEDDDSQNIYPSNFKSDSNGGTSTFSDSDKHGSTSAHNQKQQLQVSSSFLTESECNTQSSLSLGEVSPNYFRAPLMESTHIDERNPSSTFNKRIENNPLQLNVSNIRHISTHSVSSASSAIGTPDEHNLRNCPTAIQTVEEQVHAMFE